MSPLDLPGQTALTPHPPAVKSLIVLLVHPSSLWAESPERRRTGPQLCLAWDLSSAMGADTHTHICRETTQPCPPVHPLYGQVLAFGT